MITPTKEPQTTNMLIGTFFCIVVFVRIKSSFKADQKTMEK